MPRREREREREREKERERERERASQRARGSETGLAFLQRRSFCLDLLAEFMFQKAWVDSNDYCDYRHERVRSACCAEILQPWACITTQSAADSISAQCGAENDETHDE